MQLAQRPWSGNVRELEHALERAVLLASSDILGLDDFAEREVSPPRLGIGSLAGLTVREVEKQLIFATLERTRNNRTQAAKLLGISIRTLRNKLSEYRSRGELPTAFAADNG